MRYSASVSSVVSGSQQDEADHDHPEQRREDQPELAPHQPPQHPGEDKRRVAPPGQRVARGPVRDGQHQVGPVPEAGARRQQPGARVIVGQPADHRARRHVVRPGHVQGALLHPDVTGGRLAQRRGHERRRRHGRAGQHHAVREQHPDVLAQPPVEDGQHQPEAGVEFLRPQPGVQVADIVLPDDGQRLGRLHVRVGEGLAGQLGVLQHPDPRQRADLRPVVMPPVRQDHRHPLAVPGGQLLGDAVRQRPVTADDEVVAATIRAPGERRHAEDHNGR